DSHVKLNQFDSAFEAYRLAISDYRSIKDQGKLGRTLWLAGRVLSRDLKQPAKSVPYVTEAIPLLEAENDFLRATIARLYLGSIYFRLGGRENVEKVAQISREAVRIATEKNLTEQIGLAHALLAYSLEGLGSYEEAIEHYHLFLKYDRDVGGSDYTSPAYSVEYLERKAKIYRNLSRYEEAIANYRALLLKRTETRDKNGQAFALTMLAEIYSWLGDPDTAIQFYKQALEL